MSRLHGQALPGWACGAGAAGQGLPGRKPSPAVPRWRRSWTRTQVAPAGSPPGPVSPRLAGDQDVAGDGLVDPVPEGAVRGGVERPEGPTSARGWRRPPAGRRACSTRCQRPPGRRVLARQAPPRAAGRPGSWPGSCRRPCGPGRRRAARVPWLPWLPCWMPYGRSATTRSADAAPVRTRRCGSCPLSTASKALDVAGLVLVLGPPRTHSRQAPRPRPCGHAAPGR